MLECCGISRSSKHIGLICARKCQPTLYFAIVNLVISLTAIECKEIKFEFYELKIFTTVYEY